MNPYETISHNSKEYPSGMRRDDDTGKPRYDLIPPAPLKRLAQLYARGAELYGDRNWEQAETVEELARIKASAWRHFAAWAGNEDTGEDEAIAAVWNLLAYETIKDKLNAVPEK